MNKTTKKSLSKVSHKETLKNLDVTPAKGGSVRGGLNPQPLPPRKIPS